MITVEIKSRLREIVGADYVLDSDIDCFGYSYDSSFVPLSQKHMPDVVVRPITTAEVSAVMALASENGIPVTAQGTSSGRTGGSIPLSGGIALSLVRFNRIIEFDEKT